MKMQLQILKIKITSIVLADLACAFFAHPWMGRENMSSVGGKLKFVKIKRFHIVIVGCGGVKNLRKFQGLLVNKKN